MNLWWLLILAVAAVALYAAWRLPIDPNAEPYGGPSDES